MKWYKKATLLVNNKKINGVAKEHIKFIKNIFIIYLPSKFLLLIKINKSVANKKTNKFLILNSFKK